MMSVVVKITTVVVIAFIAGTTLHFHLVMIPEAKEQVAKNGGYAANAYREYMKQQGCYETIFGWRCLPQQGCYETIFGWRCLP